MVRNGRCGKEQDGGIVNSRETASVIFEIQLLKYSNVMKKMKGKTQQESEVKIRAPGESKERDTCMEEVANSTFSLSPD